MQTESKLSPVTEGVMKFYQTFTLESLKNLADIYSEQIKFIDPVHETNGLDDLHHYFKATMTNVAECEFNFSDVVEQSDIVYLSWQMRFQHPKLSHGQDIFVDGVSRLHIAAGRVVEQQDFYDMGAMIYQQVPVLGAVVKSIKKRMASS